MASDKDIVEVDGTGRAILVQAGDKLESPKNIISKPQALKSIYEVYKKNSIERILLFAEIEGLIAGNPPFNPRDLLEHGLGHIANFSNLDARATYERAALAYWNLLYETDTFLTITIGTTPEEIEISRVMTEEFDRVIKKWSNFKTVINTLIAQIVKFGISVAFWSDEKDWRWDVIQIERFFVATEASTNTDKLTCVCVESTFTAQELFEAYTHAKNKESGNKTGSRKSPWDAEELEKLLLRYATGNKTQGNYADFMTMQRAYQDGDINWADTFKDSIKLVSTLQKEYDGKISHYMFDAYGSGASEDFLYFIDRQYDSLEEALVLFTASPGEFSIHSNRGVGHKIYAGSQAIMQIDCSIVDMSKFTATPFLRTPVGQPGGDFQPIRVYQGTPTHIGAAEFVQTNFGANIGQLISASQYLQAKLNYNAANSGDDPSRPDANQGSVAPSEARNKSFKEFNVLKNNIQHFYGEADYVAENMVSKMVRSTKSCPGYEYAEEWKRRCIKREVPAEIFEISDSDLSSITRNLPMDWEVKAARAAGDGSTLGTILGLESLAPIQGSFGPNEALAYKKMFIKALFGKDYVETFTQDSGNPDDTAGGASLAQVENGMMQQGGQPIVEPTNTHAAHIAVHLALSDNIIGQAKQQQMNAIEVDKILTVLMPHLGEHIQFAEQSPFFAAKMQEILPKWRDLQGYANFNRKNAQAMLQKELADRQKAEGQQQEVMSDAQRKDFQAQANEKRKDFTVRSTVARADEANRTRAEVHKEKIKLESDNQKLDIQLKNANKANEIKKTRPEGEQKTTPTPSGPPSPLDNESTQNISDEITRIAGPNPARDDFEDVPDTTLPNNGKF